MRMPGSHCDPGQISASILSRVQWRRILPASVWHCRVNFVQSSEVLLKKSLQKPQNTLMPVCLKGTKINLLCTCTECSHSVQRFSGQTCSETLGK